MSIRLPLFPLGSVLYPGLVLPLHIFEDRYRQLVADLLAGPEPRQFGVIAIRQGREVGPGAVTALYETGCTAVLRRADKHPDGRFDLVTVGTDRFRLVKLADPAPYFSGDVELLGEHVGDADAAAAAVPALQRQFHAYLELLTERGGAQITISELPDEPVLLSYLVAAVVVVNLPVKQQLLEEPDALRRLAAERSLLADEISMMRSLSLTAAPELRYAPYSQN
jgi:uncharacterized protein